MKRVGLPGLFSVPVWRTSALAFLLGFLLVASIVAIVAVFTGPLPKGISEEARVEAETVGAARGRYLAQRDAERSATELAPRQAEEEIGSRIEGGDPARAYQRAYEYAWNDAVNTLSRRIPRQLLAQEEHTQWIELLR